MQPLWMKDDEATQYVVVNDKGQALHYSDEEGFAWRRVTSWDDAPHWERAALLEQALPNLAAKPPKGGYTCYEIKIKYVPKPVNLLEDAERRLARAKLTDRDAELLGIED